VGSGAISEELEDERYFGESSEDTSDVEFKLLILLLILVEPIDLELLEDLVVDDGVVSASRVAITESANVVKQSVEEIVLEVDIVADGSITASGRDITLEATVHGNATSNRSVKLAGRRGNVFGAVTDGDSSDEGVAASQGGERNDESSEVVFDVEAFHHTAVDLLNRSRTITRDIPVVGEGVQSRARSTKIVRTRSLVRMRRIRDLLSASKAGHGIKLDDPSNLPVADIGFLAFSVSHDTPKFLRCDSGEGEGGLDEC